MCIHIDVHIYIYVCIHVCVYIYIYIYIAHTLTPSCARGRTSAAPRHAYHAII